MTDKIPTKLIPIGYRVLVSVPKAAEKNKYSIELPSEYLKKEQESIAEGKLISYGELAFSGLIDDSANFPKAGTTLYFIKYAGREVKVGDVEYRVVNDDDIYAIGGYDD